MEIEVYNNTDRNCPKHGMYHQDRSFFSSSTWDECPYCDEQVLDLEWVES